MDTAFNVFIAAHRFYRITSISTVSINRLTSIFFFVQQFPYYFIVMYIGRSCLITSDQLGLAIGLYMILIAKILLTVVLGPMGIHILLPQFIFVPVTGYIAFLELLVLIAAIALNRYFHNRSIYELSFMYNHTIFI